MPHLLAFLLCEKVIVDNAGIASAISFFDAVNIDVPADEDLPRDAVLPLRWSSVAIWRRAKDDDVKEYEERLRVIAPDGSVIMEAIRALQITKTIHRNISNNNAFPVGQQGLYELELAYRDPATPQEWTSVASYPVMVTYRVFVGDEDNGAADVSTDALNDSV